MAAIYALAQSNEPALMPYPERATWVAGKYRITDRLQASLVCDQKDDILSASANRVFQGINRKTGIYFRQAMLTPGKDIPGASLRIIARQKAEFTRGMDESYTLRVNAEGIQLDAANSIGAIRGLETLQQMLMQDAEGFYVPFADIVDKPRYSWRGLMIDVSRHFIPLDVLKRNIDAMATVKMNVLHLHLTDDEGFRIESKSMPQLHQKGSDGQYFTQEEMKGLIAYARLRGIMIVPEFDMPGHTRSWFAGYPEMASAPGPYTPGPRFTLSDKDTAINIAAIMSAPTPTIDPTREEVYKLIDKFLTEMATLFPSPYMHIGADENNGAAWRQNPKIKAFMEQKGMKDTHSLQAYFVSRLYTILRKNKKTMIGWEELYGPELAKDVTVQKWIPEGGFMKTAGKADAIAEGGNPVLISTGFYTDLFMPAYIHYNNPNLPDAVHPNLWGGEAAQWTEIADARNIETRIWPRAAAIAERLWSPASRKDPEDMYNRLFSVSRQLDEQGLQHTSAYESGVRRLAGNGDPSALRTLADVLTPLKGYKNLFSRFSQPARLANNRAPLVSLCDIIPVDSEIKRRFRNNVAAYLSSRDPAKAAEIRIQLRTWESNHARLMRDASLRHAASPIAKHSENLSKLSAAGLRAMDLLEKGSTMPEEEMKSLQLLFTEARKQSAETELDIVGEIESLVKQKLLPEPAQYPLF
jgi:hexosaminidase